MLGAVALGLRQRLERGFVGDGAPQERRHAVLLDLAQPSGHAGFAEIFLRQHVGRDLAPARGHFDAVKREHHRAIGVADLALRRLEADQLVRRRRTLGVVPFDAHSPNPPLLMRTHVRSIRRRRGPVTPTFHFKNDSRRAAVRPPARHTPARNLTLQLCDSLVNV